MNKHLTDLLLMLEGAEGAFDAWNATVQAMCELGADDIIYGTAEPQASISFLTTLPDWRMTHYQQMNYAQYDVQARHAMTKLAPAALDIAGIEAQEELSAE